MPSRRNSGFEATAKLTPSRLPEIFSINAVAAAFVPGGTVLRITTMWKVDLERIASAIDLTADIKYVVSRRPSGAFGVPTHKNEILVLDTASIGEVVAEISPALKPSCMTSSTSRSTIVGRPFAIRLTLLSSTSHPTTL